MIDNKGCCKPPVASTLADVSKYVLAMLRPVMSSGYSQPNPSQKGVRDRIRAPLLEEICLGFFVFLKKIPPDFSGMFFEEF